MNQSIPAFEETLPLKIVSDLGSGPGFITSARTLWKRPQWMKLPASHSAPWQAAPLPLARRDSRRCFVPCPAARSEARFL